MYTHKNSCLAGCTAVTTRICLSIINYDEMPLYTTLHPSQMMAIFSHYCEIFKLIPCQSAQDTALYILSRHIKSITD